MVFIKRRRGQQIDITAPNGEVIVVWVNKTGTQTSIGIKYPDGYNVRRSEAKRKDKADGVQES